MGCNKTTSLPNVNFLSTEKITLMLTMYLSKESEVHNAH